MSICATGYFYQGFLSIQRAADLAIMREVLTEHKLSAAPLAGVDVELKSFPYPRFLNDSFSVVLREQLSLIVMLSFVIVAPIIVNDVVLEKEKKLKVQTENETRHCLELII